MNLERRSRAASESVKKKQVSQLGMTIKVKGGGKEGAAERFLTSFRMTSKSKRVKKKQVPRSSE